MSPRTFAMVLVLLVAAIVVLSGVGYAQYTEKLKHPELRLDTLYFKLETNLDPNTTTVNAELYLHNAGQKDATGLSVEMLAIDRSAHVSGYSVYINRTSGDIPDIQAGKTVIAHIKLDLPPGHYTMELRIYLEGMRLFSARRDITLSKETVKEEGALSQEMIPEFSDLVLPLAGVIVLFLLARRHALKPKRTGLKGRR